MFGGRVHKHALSANLHLKTYRKRKMTLSRGRGGRLSTGGRGGSCKISLFSCKVHLDHTPTICMLLTL